MGTVNICQHFNKYRVFFLFSKLLCETLQCTLPFQTKCCVTAFNTRDINAPPNSLENILLPHFLSQVNTFVVDSQVVMASEALPTLLTLVCFLP